MNKLILRGCVLIGVFVMTSSNVLAQKDSLEKRVENLENYVQSIQPGLNDFVENLQNNLMNYTKELQTGLENYSKGMEGNLDARIQSLNRKVVVLNPVSRSYQRIDANTGIFLISVEKIEPFDDGVRVQLNIGNPNYADYKDFKIRLIWGKHWNKNSAVAYADWRRSLQGAEFTFQGDLQKGVWNQVTLELGSVKIKDLEYMECELEVLGVQLPVRQ